MREAPNTTEFPHEAIEVFGQLVDHSSVVRRIICDDSKYLWENVSQLLVEVGVESAHLILYSKLCKACNDLARKFLAGVFLRHSDTHIHS